MKRRKQNHTKENAAKNGLKVLYLAYKKDPADDKARYDYERAKES